MGAELTASQMDGCSMTDDRKSISPTPTQSNDVTGS